MRFLAKKATLAPQNDTKLITFLSGIPSAIPHPHPSPQSPRIFPPPRTFFVILTRAQSITRI